MAAVLIRAAVLAVVFVAGLSAQSTVERNRYHIEALEANAERLGKVVEANQKALLELDRTTLTFASGQASVLSRLDAIEESQKAMRDELSEQSRLLAELVTYGEAGSWYAQISTVILGLLAGLLLLFARLTHLKRIFSTEGKGD